VDSTIRGFAADFAGDTGDVDASVGRRELEAALDIRDGDAAVEGLDGEVGRVGDEDLVRDGPGFDLRADEGLATGSAADGGDGLSGDIALADLAVAAPAVALHCFFAVVADTEQ
jgi:hypothetical protein